MWLYSGGAQQEVDHLPWWSTRVRSTTKLRGVELSGAVDFGEAPRIGELCAELDLPETLSRCTSF
ncbi:hypothetical protein SGLAM104S_09160 [Streptomyces glaucescens]